MNRYVKKPIAIEAVKWKGFNNDEIKDFAGDNVKGGGRTGEARKDEVSLLPLGLHYPYRYSIVTTRTFPIGIRFTSRTKISYYTIIV